MSFSASSYAVLSLFIAGVILMYFLRKRYEDVTISSVVLWSEAMREKQASPYLNTLQKNKYLFFHLLILGLLCLALMQPTLSKSESGAVHTVIVIDQSAVMQSVRDDGESQLDYAIREAVSLVESTKPYETTVILAGGQPEVLIERENEQERVIRTLNSIEPGYHSSSFLDSLRLADSFTVGDAAVVHAYSTAIDPAFALDLNENVRWNFHMNDSGVENVSVESFGVTAEDGVMTGVAQITNQTDQQMAFTMKVEGPSGELARREESLEADETAVFPVEELPLEDYYRLILEVDDQYTLDNEMVAILPGQSSVIEVQSSVHPLLLKGLQAGGNDVRVVDNWQAEDSVHVVTGEERSSLTAPTLIVGSSGEEKAVSSTITSEDHELVRFADLSSVYIESAGEPIEGLETIVSADGQPLIQYGWINQVPVVAILFDIENSDWPLQPSFPIVLFQAMTWLQNQSSFLGYFEPEEIRLLSVAGEAETTWDIYDRMDNFAGEWDVSDGTFQAPAKTGIFELTQGDESRYLAVMLPNDQKSVASSASYAQGKVNEANSREVQWSGIPFWLILIGFLVLLTEWEVFRRER